MKPILLMLVCVGFCAPVMAQPAPPPRPMPPPSPPAEEEAVGARTVKLTFRFEPQNPGDQPSVILCAGGRFGVALSLEGGGNVIHARIGGRLRLLDDKQVFITFEAEVGMKNQDGGGGMTAAEGSARLTVGKERKVATIGDRSLVVTAAFED